MDSLELAYAFPRSKYDDIKRNGLPSGDIQSYRHMPSSVSPQEMVAIYDLARLIKDKKVSNVNWGGRDEAYFRNVSPQDYYSSSTPAQAAVYASNNIDPKYLKIFDPQDKTWRMIDANGYARIYQEKPEPRNWTKFVYEHRAVIEKTLGRKLSSSEVVHHQSRRRDENTSHNLAVASSQSEHVRKDHPEWIKKKASAFMSDVLDSVIEKIAIIKQEGGEFKIYSHSGKVLGTHASRESALRQERAIEAHKHGR